MNKEKKLKKYLPLLVVSLITSIMTPASVSAETLTSQRTQEAICLTADTSIEGSASTQNSDIYSFTMPGTGYVTFSVKNLEFKSGIQDRNLISIYNSSGINLNTYTNFDKESFSSGRYNFKSGDILYIEVSAEKKYSISANFTGMTSWESESNDNFMTATHLSAGKARCGTAYYTYDKDFYTFVASKNKNGKQAVKLNFSIATANKEKNGILDSYRITVYNTEKHEICHSKNLSQNYSVSFKVNPGKRYYIMVDPAGSNNIDALYKIKIAYKK